MTLHDLAADWSWMDEPDVIGFSIANGSVVWETAAYTERGGSIRVERLDVRTDGEIGRRVRYLSPETLVRVRYGRSER